MLTSMRTLKILSLNYNNTKHKKSWSFFNPHIENQKESNYGFTFQNNSRVQFFDGLFMTLFRVISLLQRCMEVLTYHIKQKYVRKVRKTKN